MIEVTRFAMALLIVSMFAGGTFFGIMIMCLVRMTRDKVNE